MTMSPRPTSLFLSHGGETPGLGGRISYESRLHVPVKHGHLLLEHDETGPGFLMTGRTGGMKQIDATSAAAQWYHTFTKKWTKPSAIVVVSAHWEGRGAIKVTTGEKHPLLFDYYGFPDYCYDLEYAPPGHPELARRIIELLEADGFNAQGDDSRGYDHGTFIPLKLMYPDADIPVVQVSLLGGLDPEKHLNMGKTLKKLVDERDVLVVGSGQATHGRGSDHRPYPPGKGAPKEEAFVDWLKETAASPAVTPEERQRRLREWERDAPHGRNAHPREEHLLPLHVAAGCTGFQPGSIIFDDFAMGHMSLACVGFWPGGGEGEAKGGDDEGVCSA